MTHLPFKKIDLINIIKRIFILTVIYSFLIRVAFSLFQTLLLKNDSFSVLNQNFFGYFQSNNNKNIQVYSALFISVFFAIEKIKGIKNIFLPIKYLLNLQLTKYILVCSCCYPMQTRQDFWQS